MGREGNRQRPSLSQCISLRHRGSVHWPQISSAPVNIANDPAGQRRRILDDTEGKRYPHDRARNFEELYTKIRPSDQKEALEAHYRRKELLEEVQRKIKEIEEAAKEIQIYSELIDGFAMQRGDGE